jgi:hypothetical protein
MFIELGSLDRNSTATLLVSTALPVTAGQLAVFAVPFGTRPTVLALYCWPLRSIVIPAVSGQLFARKPAKHGGVLR